MASCGRCLCTGTDRRNGTVFTASDIMLSPVNKLFPPSPFPCCTLGIGEQVTLSGQVLFASIFIVGSHSWWLSCLYHMPWLKLETMGTVPLSQKPEISETPATTYALEPYWCWGGKGCYLLGTCLSIVLLVQLCFWFPFFRVPRHRWVLCWGAISLLGLVDSEAWEFRGPMGFHLILSFIPCLLVGAGCLSSLLLPSLFLVAHFG